MRFHFPDPANIAASLTSRLQCTCWIPTSTTSPTDHCSLRKTSPSNGIASSSVTTGGPISVGDTILSRGRSFLEAF